MQYTITIDGTPEKVTIKHAELCHCGELAELDYTIGSDPYLLQLPEAQIDFTEEQLASIAGELDRPEAPQRDVWGSVRGHHCPHCRCEYC